MQIQEENVPGRGKRETGDPEAETIVMCLRIRSKVKARKNAKVRLKGKSDCMKESVAGEKVERKGKGL